MNHHHHHHFHFTDKETKTEKLTDLPKFTQHGESQNRSSTVIDLFALLEQSSWRRIKPQKPGLPSVEALPTLSPPRPHPNAHSYILHWLAIPSPLLASENSPSQALSAPTRSINHNDSGPPALGGPRAKDTRFPATTNG